MARPTSALQNEIKQTKPFHSLAQEATLGLLRTADIVREHLQATLAPSGLTLQQYNVLRILRGAGPSGLPTLEISQRMLERAPGITRLLDRLEAKGMVRRERCLSDRRQVLCWPTPAALVLLASLDSIVERTDCAGAAGLSPQAQAQLVRALDTVRAAHAQMRADANAAAKHHS